jgi:hypothetical protein
MGGMGENYAEKEDKIIKMMNESFSEDYVEEIILL